MRLKSVARVLALATAVSLAGCQANDVLALKDRAPIPQDALAFMKAHGMTKSSPIMVRIFKEENALEIWKQKDTGRYALVKTYEICKHSGGLGPKFKEGDRQAPEGFYLVSRHHMNPNSAYHLSFNLGFPNQYDQSHGRTGSHLMVHGDCSSAGCYAMTDEGIAEIYAFAREALYGGRQDAFQVQAFPFRMTAENMARHRGSSHFEYWSMLKEGYDHFELTKQPPKIDVCERRYVFNQVATVGEFKAEAACPEMSMPETLATAYLSHQRVYQSAFEEAVAKLEGRLPADGEAALTPIPPQAAPPAVQPADLSPYPVPAAAPAVQPADLTQNAVPVPLPAELPVSTPVAQPVAASPVEPVIAEAVPVIADRPISTPAAPLQ